jgi:hypothetical protein
MPYHCVSLPERQMPQYFLQALSAREKYRPVLSCVGMTQVVEKGYIQYIQEVWC